MSKRNLTFPFDSSNYPFSIGSDDVPPIDFDLHITKNDERSRNTKGIRFHIHWPFISYHFSCPSQEMENIQMPKYEMPEMSEMLTSLFGGGDAKKAVKSSGSSKGVAKRKAQN